jgi:TPR repeat protein
MYDLWRDAAVRSAARKGDAAAQFQLGLCLATGKGAPRDLAHAVLWFNRASMQCVAPKSSNMALEIERRLSRQLARGPHAPITDDPHPISAQLARVLHLPALACAFVAIPIS